ncbi:MAG: pyridoxal 5'-phosphate synthase lyase subunit PdxS [Euryarchaeota archaeon]|nr:pyridoxal 5'-phosphate synthase lyase subunit PdxS [Euryarchaeota archaeon]
MVDITSLNHGTELVKRGFAQMQEGGVIMDVVTPQEAQIAEDAGATAVMALERVPADIRSDGGVARMSHPDMIRGIMETTSIPVMAKARIGHEDEARVLEILGVDMIDESEVLTPADPFFHIAKKNFTVPFVCGCTNMSEAVRRIVEGAAMIRTKGEAGTGNVVSAVQHARLLNAEMEFTRNNPEMHSKIVDSVIAPFKRLEEISEFHQLDLALENTPFGTIEELKQEIEQIVSQIASINRLPVVTFSAGGIATPADAALMMRHSMDGVFVGSGIFKSSDPSRTAEAIVLAAHHHNDSSKVEEACRMAGTPMPGLEIETLDVRMDKRGW